MTQQDPRQTLEFSQERSLPLVARPISNWSTILIAAGMLAIGILLFISLENRRRDKYSNNYNNIPKNVRPTENRFSLYIPNAQNDEIVSYPPPDWKLKPETYQETTSEPLKNKEIAVVQKQVSAPPAPIYFQPPPINAYAVPPYIPPSTPPPAQSPSNFSSTEPALVYDRFQSTAPADTTIRISLPANKTTLISQGTLIPAVLETPIDSSHPGVIRAIVMRDVRGFDGTKVLVPKGSQLVGEFRADATQKQSRAFVIWNRLILPDAYSIALTSPSSDKIGNPGISGQTDTHFFERFGAAFLNTVFQVGSSLISRKNSTSIIIANTGTGQNISPYQVNSAQYLPTIRVKQGAIINVMVAKDLSFAGIGENQR